MKIETQHVDIQGLNCPNCAAKVERAVAGLSGVQNAAVEFDTGRARFEYHPDKVTLERISHIVAQTGCDSNRFTISIDGNRIPPNDRHTAADGGDESHDGY